jgi:hypothetical protein
MDKIILTKSGIECKDIAFNNAVNLYLGMVKDNWSSNPDTPWTTCSWHKSGKCINRNRPELDIDVKQLKTKEEYNGANFLRDLVLWLNRCNEYYNVNKSPLTLIKEYRIYLIKHKL